MARALSQPNRVFPLLADAFSFPLHRRGYAAAVSDVSVRRVRLDRIASGGGAMVGKVEENGVARNGNGSEASSAWAPDPVTGYYRPINHAHDIDPVELRRMLLNHRVRSSLSSP